MASACRVGRPVVLEEWELLAQPGARRAAGQLRPLPREVGLVGVPARGGDLGQRPAAQHAPGRLEPGDPLVLLRRQPGLLPDQGAEPAPAVADLVAPRRPPARPGSARPAPGPPRPAGRASPLRASAGVSAGATTASPCPRGPRRAAARAGRPGRARRRSSSSSSPASSAAGTPSSARAPAVVSAELDPALGPVVVDRRRRRVQPGHRRPARCSRARVRRPSPTSSGSPTGSTKVRLVVGSPRCTPGAPRSPS